MPQTNRFQTKLRIKIHPAEIAPPRTIREIDDSGYILKNEEIEIFTGANYQTNIALFWINGDGSIESIHPLFGQTPSSEVHIEKTNESSALVYPRQYPKGISSDYGVEMCLMLTSRKEHEDSDLESTIDTIENAIDSALKATTKNFERSPKSFVSTSINFDPEVASIRSSDLSLFTPSPDRIWAKHFLENLKIEADTARLIVIPNKTEP